jgi:hypothetical protein
MYMSNVPFNTVENAYWRRFFTKLNPAYIAAHRNTFAGPLLDQTYAKTKQEVEAKLKGKVLNIVTDESTDVTRNRIVSMSVNSARLTFFYNAEDVGAQRMDTENYTLWLLTQLEALTGGDYSRINSIATDTCATMLKVWTLVREHFAQQQPELRLLFVPCDSHGLQLLLKDILEIPWFAGISTTVKKTVAHFRHSHLQYSRLKVHQRNLYGKEIALIVSVITRWGTEYRSALSVRKNKEAILAHLDDRHYDMPHEVSGDLMNRRFWADLDQFLEIIQPIHEGQVMSEADNSHIGHVVNRWLGIERHFETIVQRAPNDDGAPAGLCLEPYARRLQRQIQPLHWAAHYLDPLNVGRPFESQVVYDAVHRLINYLDGAEYMFDYRPPAGVAVPAIHKFALYRAQDGPFHEHSPAWGAAENPRAFWVMMHEFAPRISRVAIRLFRTPCNSVSSERSFSVQNIIHDKKRNRLQPARTNKLMYIYVNRRVLDRVEGEPFRWEHLNDEQLLELEEWMLDHEYQQLEEVIDDYL